ncbi:hypothetical protein GC093_23735 [Paenibacillus sp. LMG 31456]|uniref:Uncharacterized protein n=1 Tax=Paenibacillus foliorum TaxID=2654974 RepID=A0A972GXX9_9BACL|nr:hypothetical protein [Paenibacillus foliorum]NOU96213.1 hypothetical protein [Paenibacillus foliorum]
MVEEQNYQIEKGLVTPRGIEFRKSFYTSPSCIEHKWFELAERAGEWIIPIAVQPSNQNEIILFDIAKISLNQNPYNIEDREKYFQKMQELKSVYFSQNSRRFK